MRIERLRLSNFRGFAELDLEFPKQGTTVLVGNNGAGKTSVLDAIGCLLQEVSSSMQEWDAATGEPLTTSDIRMGAKDCSIELSATRSTADSAPLHLRWEATLPTSKRTDNTQGHRSSQDAADFFGPPHHPPFVIYFSVERVFHGELSPWLLPNIEDATKALNARNPISTEYLHFVRWFFDRENLENELIRDDPSFRDPELSAVRSAIERLCEGFSNLRIRRARVSAQASRSESSTKFVVDKFVNGRKDLFELDQLSHGERGLLALVGLIASCLSRLHANRPDPLDGLGIVLIDEIELHLHPGWQRNIIPSLERTFPSVQFIVTTHSPQVLSQMRPENVKIIENFKLVERTPPTYGRDSNAILEDVMGVPERPAFATEKLADIAGLIDQENWTTARERLNSLARDLGALDAEVVRLRAMIDMLDDARDAAK